MGNLIMEGVLATVRKWHGGIDDQYSNIDNAVKVLTAGQTKWVLPKDLLDELTANRNQIRTLIDRCRTTEASTMDRMNRSTLLKMTVGICLTQVKLWAYGEYAGGAMTAGDIHQLGFLLPGETGGYHGHREEIDITAEVKTRVISADIVRVVIDQSAGENAAQVVHGWPPGVKHALIVITADDGKTEVYRKITTRLYNDILMPDGSHGQQFFVKASFLKHV
ncbi:MAG: hypothetical protein LBK07_03100, partial [Tannerella sp.]|nr:hypothetical protein [Tannerella sp.]